MKTVKETFNDRITDAPIRLYGILAYETSNISALQLQNEMRNRFNDDQLTVKSYTDNTIEIESAFELFRNNNLKAIKLGETNRYLYQFKIASNDLTKGLFDLCIEQQQNGTTTRLNLPIYELMSPKTSKSDGINAHIIRSDFNFTNHAELANNLPANLQEEFKNVHKQFTKLPASVMLMSMEALYILSYFYDNNTNKNDRISKVYLKRLEHIVANLEDLKSVQKQLLGGFFILIGAAALAVTLYFALPAIIAAATVSLALVISAFTALGVLAAFGIAAAGLYAIYDNKGLSLTEFLQEAYDGLATGFKPVTMPEPVSYVPQPEANNIHPTHGLFKRNEIEIAKMKLQIAKNEFNTKFIRLPGNHIQLITDYVEHQFNSLTNQLELRKLDKMIQLEIQIKFYKLSDPWAIYSHMENANTSLEDETVQKELKVHRTHLVINGGIDTFIEDCLTEFGTVISLN